jgi:glucokinase
VNGPFVIGVDIGGSLGKLVLMADDGAVVADRRIDTGLGVTSERLVPAIVTAIDALRADGGASRDCVAGLGLVVPGFIDVDRSRSLSSPNTPGLVGDQLPTDLARATGLPVVFDSDVNAAAFGEAVWGVGRDVPRFLTLTIGTGIGGGLVVNGSIMRIAGGTIGDIGHVIVQPGGRRCRSGCAGCAEALVGADGLVAIARDEGAPASVDRASLVIAAVAAGEEWAVRTSERAGRLIGILVASLMPILLPDRVALVGGTVLMGGSFMESVRATVEALGGPLYVRGRAIVEGRFATTAGAVGAAALALQERRQALEQ